MKKQPAHQSENGNNELIYSTIANCTTIHYNIF